MKKTIIAGASAVALAALPMAGVFAATQTSVEDTVQLTVTKTCAMDAASGTNTINLGSAAAGSSYTEKAGSVLTVTCNATAGWEITATTTSMERSTGDTNPIAFGNFTTATGSIWSAALTATGGTVTSGWDDYTAGPASNTVVVSGTQVNSITVSPKYKAKTSSIQPDGTYSGSITYTFTDKTQPQP